MADRNETPLERARREWREAAEKKKNQSVNPLTISSRAISNEEDIKRTILVTNIPHNTERVEEKLREIFNVPGGIRAAHLYPKGNTQSALVEFNEYTQLSGNYLRNYAKIDNNFIDIQPSKICIRQFQNTQHSNLEDLLKQKNEELKLAKSGGRAIHDPNSEIEKLRQIIKEKDAEIKSLQELVNKMNGALVETEGLLKRFGIQNPNTFLFPKKTSITTTTTTNPVKSPSPSTKPEDEASINLIQQILAEEKKKREEELKAKTYLCPICYMDYPIEDIFILDGCFHRFCRECITGWITTKISDGEVKIVTCPETKCTQEITYNEIRHIITDKDTFAKYEKFSLEKALEEIPGLRWCPRPGCGNAMIGGADSLMMRCSNPSCQFCFCFKCKEEWHADATCAQFQQWKKDNGSSGDNNVRKWIQQNTKKCPRCTVNIEKNGGCNHMTCRSCNYEFCWICSGEYSYGHFENTLCPQYS